MKKIIVTADDFGMCQSVDDAIIDLINGKTLSSTNIITNMGNLQNVNKLKQLKDISVGIHWNITAGKPVLKSNEIPTITKENGEFLSLNELKKAIVKNKVNPREIKEELEAQYDIFLNCFGEKPSYWNTHQNSGLIPEVYRLCSQIALRKGIKGTRNFQRVYLDFCLVKNPKRRIREHMVKVLMDYWFGFIAHKKYIMPEGRIITFYNKSKCNGQLMTTALAQTKKKSIEIVIHPATNIDCSYFGNIAEDRVTEYMYYKSEEWKKIASQYELICFEQL